MKKSLLTASRMSAFLTCPRKHFWAYERGLRTISTGAALRIGSAWARAMEARWKKLDVTAVLDAAFADKDISDPVEAETIAALLDGYYAYYGNEDNLINEAYPEVEFRMPLASSRTFLSAGKIDGLIQLHDGRIGLIEHKTTSDSVEPQSDYWTRLRFNPQVLQYVTAAKSLNWPVDVVIYDVVRKPSIRPKEINELDEQGRKIAVDHAGNRVFLKNGEPRQSADTANGVTIKSRVETPEEFGARLAQDCRQRPEFYFARREVPILDSDLDEFEHQRTMVARMIMSCREQERRAKVPERAWPRSVGQSVGSPCDFCDYSSFCLQNIQPDLQAPPAGFRVGPVNPELENANTAGTAPSV